MSAELVNRHDMRRSGIGRASDCCRTPTTPAIPIRRPPLATAAARATSAQLSLDLLGAFALGDVNRIAESFHWVGLSHQQAQQVMQRLQHLADSRADVHWFDAQIWPGWSSGRRWNGGGVMQLIFVGAGTQVLDLDVERYSGCYFVTLLNARSVPRLNAAASDVALIGLRCARIVASAAAPKLVCADADRRLRPAPACC